jgi:hypothetical protein
MGDATKIETDVPRLCDGSNWADHEDCIVGNEAGLRRLVAACHQALDQGKYYGNDLGEYVGVKKLDSAWFKDPGKSRQTRFGSFLAVTFLLALLGLILVGAVTVIKWFF